MPKLSGQSMICDASSLISLTDSCFIHALYFLKRRYKGRFIIPPSVEYECVEHPRQMKMHAIHALRLRRAVQDGTIDVVDAHLQKQTEAVKWVANNVFSAGGTPLRILHQGEAEMIALSNETGVENMLIDERTTRMLAEEPHALKEHFEKEFHRPVSINEGQLAAFARLTKNMRFFRSTELLALAIERGYFSDYGELEQEAAGAALYKLKYAGCSVGFGEIEAYLQENLGRR